MNDYDKPDWRFLYFSNTEPNKLVEEYCYHFSAYSKERENYMLEYTLEENNRIPDAPYCLIDSTTEEYKTKLAEFELIKVLL